MFGKDKKSNELEEKKENSDKIYKIIDAVSDLVQMVIELWDAIF